MKSYLFLLFTILTSSQLTSEAIHAQGIKTSHSQPVSNDRASLPQGGSFIVVDIADNIGLLRQQRISLNRGSDSNVQVGDVGEVEIGLSASSGNTERQLYPIRIVEVSASSAIAQIEISEGLPVRPSNARIFVNSPQNAPASSFALGVTAFTTADGLAAAQELMRVGRYAEAVDVLNRLNGETESERNAIANYKMFAFYALGDYTQVTAEGRNLSNPSAAQTSLIASALIQRGAFTEAQQLLEAAAPIESVAVNLALVYLEQDRSLTIECSSAVMGRREQDDFRNQCRRSDLIAGRQERARNLLSQFPGSLLAHYNLALLDIEADEFNTARGRMRAISSAIANTATYDPTTLYLKQASLWYVVNYDANVQYLRQSQIPLEILEVAAAGQMLNVIGTGLAGGNISGRAVGNLIATGIAAAAAQQQLDEVTTVLRDNFRRNINFLPAAVPPDGLNYTIF